MLDGGTLVVILGVAVALASLFLIKRSALQHFMEVAGVLVSVLTIGEKIWRARRPADPRPVDTLADWLGQAVRGQWRKTATERMLMTPAPIPVGWSLSDLLVAGPVEAAVGDPDAVPAFPPLPGQTRVTEEQLRAGGGRGELFAVYAGIASGRVVVVGAPGAGKTGTAILLLLDALEHRDRVDDKDRARIPVPVLFTAHGWDPATCSVQDWLAAKLAADYPLFKHRGGHAEAAALVAAGAVALILDGLDEMDIARRPAALQALSDAPFRVVVLTRSQEMEQAAGAAWLVGAVAVHLHPITGPEGADYLQQARTGPAPAGWTQLLTHLREDPDSVLAHGLSTPLTLTLIRDTYRPDHDVSDLLDNTRWSTGEDLEQYLIARVLPNAYTPRPGRPEPRYSLSQAKQALVFLARQMNRDHTRDLAWWQIPRWTPTAPRILATGLMVALVGEFAVGLASALRPDRAALGDPLGEGMAGLISWLAGRLTARAASRLRASAPVGLGGGEPQRRAKTMNWHAFRSRSVLLVAFAVCLVVMTLDSVFVLLEPSVGFGVGYELAVGLVASLAIAFVTWLVFGLAVGLIGTGSAEGSPLGPCGSWRYDRRVGLAGGVVLGFAGAVVAGLSNGLGFSTAALTSPGKLVVGLELGLAFWLVVGLAFWLGVSQTWQTVLAWLCSRRVPVVSLLPFLEDALDRGVLRTVGAVYQFRHATLQDHLAGQTTPSPPASPATQRAA